MELKDILESDEYNKLLQTSISKTFAKFKLYIIMEKGDFEQEVYLFIINPIKRFDISKSSLYTFIPMMVKSCAKQKIVLANGQSKNWNKLEIQKTWVSLDNQVTTDSDISDFIPSEYNLEYEAMNNLKVETILKSKILTERQREILTLIYKGLTQKEIAKELHCTQSNVSLNFQYARKKLLINFRE